MTVLSDPLPLRTSAVWEDATALILPWVFGRTTLKAVAYPFKPRTYVLADHALTGVDTVTVNGDKIAGWRQRNGYDVTGHAVAFLDLAADPGTATVAAQVRGLPGDPASILATLGVESDLRDLTVTLRQLGITLGGALTASMTYRAAIQFVVNQFGGSWSAGMPGFAQRFPPDATAPTWATLGPLDRGELTAECQLSDLVTRLVIPFDWDYAEGKARQTVTLISASGIERYDEREQERPLPWIKTAREATAIGQRWLDWASRPLWTLTFQAGPELRELPPGAWIALTGSDSPVQGRAVVLDVDPGLGSGTVRVTAQAPANGNGS